MISHRYILEPYKGKSSRYTCPACKKPLQFTRYIDTDTGETIAKHVGKCNRINKCAYHYTPKQYFYENGISYSGLQGRDISLSEKRHIRPVRSVEDTSGRRSIQPDYIDNAIFLKSLSAYKNNNFVKYLHSRFNAETVNQLIKDYHIGTSSHWNGGTTVFWQLDTDGYIRTGKLMKYCSDSGKREKNKTNWAHAAIGLPDFNLKQCLFGEHLLNKFPDKTVGIVESEKTAILASVFIPNLLWFASGGANGLSKTKLKILRNREVILFPDASANGHIFESWKVIAKNYGFTCSDFIEKSASDEQKAQGVDIADMLESVTIKCINDRKPDDPAPLNIYRANDELADTSGCTDVRVAPINKWKNEEHTFPKASTQLPYNTPSPVAIIDSQINTRKVFKGEGLVIKNRIFVTASGDKLELIGIRDYGFCGNYDEHKKQKGYCKECILNCLHSVKINGELQKWEYTQLEILMMQ